jgi:hypothetical protein
MVYMRAFFVYTSEDRTSTVKEKGRQQTYTFSDILDALAFIRREAGTDRAQVTCLDAVGKVVFECIV